MKTYQTLAILLGMFVIISLSVATGYVAGRLDAPVYEPGVADIHHTTFEIKQGFITVLTDKGDWEMTVDKFTIEEKQK